MHKVEYIHETDCHNTIAASAFIPDLLQVIQPKSVLDIGCGLGTWLKVFKDTGTSDVMGIDGVDVDKSMLAIPAENFAVHDFTQPLFLNRKFELAVCLEVAEHLPESAADNLVDILTNHADNILFSAALPMQGGQNHVNEQPFMYWVKKFNDKGFIVEDLFRYSIWNNKNINWWYKQNMFFVKRSVDVQKQVLDFYHPDRFREVVEQYNVYTKDHLLKEQDLEMGKIPVKRAVKILLSTIKRKIYGR